jgi:hypothetical protein
VDEEDDMTTKLSTVLVPGEWDAVTPDGDSEHVLDHSSDSAPTRTPQ